MNPHHEFLLHLLQTAREPLTANELRDQYQTLLFTKQYAGPGYTQREIDTILAGFEESGKCKRANDLWEWLPEPPSPKQRTMFD